MRMKIDSVSSADLQNSFELEKFLIRSKSELVIELVNLPPELSWVLGDATETKQVTCKQIKMCEKSPSGRAQNRAANR
jgi:hypothetical protein